MAKCTAGIPGNHIKESARDRCPVCGPIRYPLAPSTAEGATLFDPRKNFPSEDDREVLAASERTPQPVLAMLLRNNPSVPVVALIAANPSTHPTDLEKIWEMGTPFREPAASNPSISEDVLFDSVTSESPSLRAAAARNPDIPEDWMLDIAEDEGEAEVLEALCENGGATDRVVGAIARKERFPLWFDEGIARDLESRHIMKRFAIDSDDAVDYMRGFDWWELDADSTEAFVAKAMHQNVER